MRKGYEVVEASGTINVAFASVSVSFRRLCISYWSLLNQTQRLHAEFLKRAILSMDQSTRKSMEEDEKEMSKVISTSVGTVTDHQ